MEINVFKKLIEKKLWQLGLNLEMFELYYNEKHRHFHTLEHHIYPMLLKAHESDILSGELLAAIMFHDIIYDPKSNTNEEDSVKVLLAHFKHITYLIDIKSVSESILSTKNHIPIEGNEISKRLINLDMDSILGGFSNKDNFVNFIQDEEKIFKEYQFVDYKEYKLERIKFLQAVGAKQHYIDYVKNRMPKIAVYAGSFNPFHVGHYNILKKAEKIFDKVIIARGNNLEKNSVENYKIPEELKFYQQDEYSGLLIDYLKSLDYPVTLIRGLRNSSDFNFEKTQSQILKDLDSNIKIVNIISDSEFEHISSTAIRNLKNYNNDTYKKYLI